MYRVRSVLVFALLLTGCPDAVIDSPSSGLDREVGWLLHVRGRSSEDIFVVGGEPDRGRMLHFDGAVWADEKLPTGTKLLNWIQLFEGGALAVGNEGEVLWNDGDGWIAEASGTEQDIWGVWGVTPDDVWAVGGNGREEGQAIILRRVGGVWTRVESPMMERPGVNAWFKVWGSGAEDVYFVGQNGGMLRWDGDSFTELGIGTSRDLIAIHGVSADAIAVVGGRSNGVVGYWDGATWTKKELSPAPGVNGVWMTAKKTAWIAGARGLLREARFDDGIDVVRRAPSSELDLHAVSVIRGLGIVAVGGNFGQPQGPYEGAYVLEELP